jgi:hypothetical protein
MLAYTTMDEANFPDEDAFLKGTGDAYGLYQLKAAARTGRCASPRCPCCSISIRP